jgi:hypothetical protein
MRLARRARDAAHRIDAIHQSRHRPSNRRRVFCGLHAPLLGSVHAVGWKGPGGRQESEGGRGGTVQAVAMPVSVGVGRGSRRAMCRRGWPIRSQRRFSLGTVCRASVLYAARSDAVQDRAINGACQGAVRVDTMHGRTPCDGRRTRRIVHGMGGSSSHALFAPPERIAVRTGGVRGFHACIDTLDRLGPPWTACRAPICWGWSRCRSTTSVMHAPQERWMKGRSTESVLIGWWRTRT